MYEDLKFVIVGPSDTFADEVMFWSNEYGWTDFANATRFTNDERMTVDEPDECYGWAQVPS